MTSQPLHKSPGVFDVVHVGDSAETLHDSYSKFFSGEKNTLEEREANAREVTETFYELVTDFYEFGYGQSFHFSPAWSDKKNEECIALYEREMGQLLKMKPGKRFLVSSYNIQ